MQQSNILVCAQGRAYLADFGLSMMLANHNTASHSVTGAARWAAPELITYPADISDLLSLQSDMYSFGSIMYHVSREFSFPTVTSAIVFLDFIWRYSLSQIIVEHPSDRRNCERRETAAARGSAN